MSPQSTKKARRRTQGTAGLPVSPQSLQMDEEKVVRSSQHGLTRDQIDCLLWWNNYLDGWGESNRYCLCKGLRQNSLFRQVLDTVFHNNLVGKLRRCRLNEWTVRWMENSLSCERTFPGSSWQCQATGQKADGNGCTGRKNIFTVQVTKHWNRLPREVVESSHWRYSRISWTQSCLWQSCLSREVGSMTHCDPFQYYPFSDSVKCIFLPSLDTFTVNFSPLPIWTKERQKFGAALWSEDYYTFTEFKKVEM